MLDPNLTVDDINGTTHSYNLISQVGQSSTRVDANTSLATPQSMLIQHKEEGKGTRVVDRHLISYRAVSTDPLIPPMVINITIAKPRFGEFLENDVLVGITELFELLFDNSLSFASTTFLNTEAILRGES